MRTMRRGRMGRWGVLVGATMVILAIAMALSANIAVRIEGGSVRRFSAQIDSLQIQLTAARRDFDRATLQSQIVDTARQLAAAQHRLSRRRHLQRELWRWDGPVTITLMMGWVLAVTGTAITTRTDSA